MPKFDVASETSFLRTGLGQLKDYLLSSEIFWNVGGSQQLTLQGVSDRRRQAASRGRQAAGRAQRRMAHGVGEEGG